MAERIARKAVLVSPRINADTFWSYARSMKKYVPRGEFGLPKMTFPPLGLMGLFNYLKPYYDTLVLVDRNIDPRPLEEHIRDADHVYMGGMIAHEDALLHDALIVKKAKKLLVIGGPIVDENSVLMEIADILVENEAEMVIDDLLSGIMDGTAKKYYIGILPPPEKFFRPDFSSINLENYTNVTLQITRGCPENCEFCDITSRFGRKPRTTPWEYTQASLKQLYELGYRGTIFIVDDNFIGNPNSALDTLKNIYSIEQELGYHFPKYTELTMRVCDDSPKINEIRHWLHKTNFIKNFIGVETNNIDSLKETRKYQNLRGTKSMAEKLSLFSEETGTAVLMGIIHGFDNDTSDSVDSLIEFINSTHVPTVMVGLMLALPHTSLWDRLKKENRLMTETSGNNSDATMNFIPYNFSAKQAEMDYVRILEGIYSPKAFFTRVMRELSLLDVAMPQNPPMGKLESLSYLCNILSKDNAATYWRYLYNAHKIAKTRFGFNTQGYRYILGQYFTYCAQFTHFKGQTDSLRERVMNRAYQPWQLSSWKDITDSVNNGEKLLNNASKADVAYKIEAMP